MSVIAIVDSWNSSGLTHAGSNLPSAPWPLRLVSGRREDKDMRDPDGVCTLYSRESVWHGLNPQVS